MRYLRLLRHPANTQKEKEKKIQQERKEREREREIGGSRLVPSRGGRFNSLVSLRRRRQEEGMCDVTHRNRLFVLPNPTLIRFISNAAMDGAIFQSIPHPLYRRPTTLKTNQ